MIMVLMLLAVRLSGNRLTFSTEVNRSHDWWMPWHVRLMKLLLLLFDQTSVVKVNPSPSEIWFWILVMMLFFNSGIHLSVKYLRFGMLYLGFSSFLSLLNPRSQTIDIGGLSTAIISVMEAWSFLASVLSIGSESFSCRHCFRVICDFRTGVPRKKDIIFNWKM